MQFQVPQFIEVEDKIFGPLTFKQFVYVGGGLGAAYIIWRLLPSFFAIPLIVIVGGVAAALAFFQFNGRPFIVAFENAFFFFLRSKLYLWNSSKKPAKVAAREVSAEKAEIYVPKLSESKLFPSGGYFISKNKEKAHLIFDCGHLGYLSTSGHGHCDTLSFILSVNRKIFFSDPGTYVYHGNPEWRNYFKSTEAHNTIKIDGKNQSEITGAFIYGKKANTKIINSKISENEDEITAYHDGYKNLGIIHERKLIHNKKKREMIIIDNIISKKNNCKRNDCKKNNEKEHSLSIFFNLHPEVKLKKINKNEYFLTNHKTKIKLTLDPNLQIQEHYGETKPIRGWYSPQFGVKIPCSCLEGKTSINQTTVITTKIIYKKAPFGR